MKERRRGWRAELEVMFCVSGFRGEAKVSGGDHGGGAICSPGDQIHLSFAPGNHQSLLVVLPLLIKSHSDRKTQIHHNARAGPGDQRSRRLGFCRKGSVGEPGGTGNLLPVGRRLRWRGGVGDGAASTQSAHCQCCPRRRSNRWELADVLSYSAMLCLLSRRDL